MERENAKRTYSRFGLSYVGMHWVYVLLYIVVLQVVKLICRAPYLPQSITLIINFGLRFAIIYPIMYLAVRSLPKHQIEKKRLGIGGFIACYCISVAIMYISNLTGLVLNSLIGRLTGVGAVNPIFDVIGSMPPEVQIIVVAILAPIFEELLFRKFLIDRTVKYGEVSAMLLSGIMFGLYHGNLAQFVYATALGMFFAFIYIRTGRIGYSIAIHMMINGVSSYLSAYVLNGSVIGQITTALLSGDIDTYTDLVRDNIYSLILLMTIGLWLLVVAVAGIILMIIFRKKFVFEHHEGEIPKGERFDTVMGNPGMIIYVFYWILSIILMQFGISILEVICKVFKFI